MFLQHHWLPYRGKMSEFHLVGVSIRPGENSRHLETFSSLLPDQNFKFVSLFPEQIYNLVTSTRLHCPNELVSFTSSKKDLVIRRLKH